MIHLVKRHHGEAATDGDNAGLEPVKPDRKEKHSDSKILYNKILLLVKTLENVMSENLESRPAAAAAIYQLEN